jgi:hypothetical protein
MSMTSICFSTASTLPLPFLLMGDDVMSYFSTLSFLDDALVKGLLALASTVVAGEGKSNLLPFVAVALFDGVYVNYRAGWGETSLCGE